VSLPYLYEIDNTDDMKIEQPYLTPTKQIDSGVSKDKINIGICWSASITSLSRDERIFSVEYLKALIEHPKFNVYTLQVGEQNNELKEYGLDDKVIDLTKDLNSFDDTASLVQQMDLVITSDTSVAHLAGGLGIELWVLLTKYPDWKWENKGDSSYWYNNATLFRQKTSMIWDSVFDSVYGKLNKKYKVQIKRNAK
jgi:ADP-heptose:LPS heptosyltransferase